MNQNNFVPFINKKNPCIDAVENDIIIFIINGTTLHFVELFFSIFT